MAKASPKADSFQGPNYGLKHLHSGKYKPKSLAKPSFFVDKAGAEKTGKKGGDYEAAKAQHGKAEGEVEKAQAEFEKLDKTAKAFAALGNTKKAKLYSDKAGVAKKNYEQKLAGANSAKKKMEKVGAKGAKPSVPAPGLAPKGEDLSGPSGLTLAKNHYLNGGAKVGVA